VKTSDCVVVVEFPTGMKWSFIDKNQETRHLVCNADESDQELSKIVI
jgi:NADH:ubiquinone oxidoreductase subunit F (NADH-binding)